MKATYTPADLREITHSSFVAYDAPAALNWAADEIERLRARVDLMRFERDAMTELLIYSHTPFWGGTTWHLRTDWPVVAGSKAEIVNMARELAGLGPEVSNG